MKMSYCWPVLGAGAWLVTGSSIALAADFPSGYTLNCPNDVCVVRIDGTETIID